jgi:hypothetical protein
MFTNELPGCRIAPLRHDTPAAFLGMTLVLGYRVKHGDSCAQGCGAPKWRLCGE